MATSVKSLFGLGLSKKGSGCLYVYCVVDTEIAVIKTNNHSKCPGLWVALCENETKLSITVCEKTAHGDECESQPTLTFNRNAVLELVDDKSALITDPYSISCFFSFESEAHCGRFCSEVDLLLIKFAKHDDLERERRIYEANDYTDPFVSFVGGLNDLPDKNGVIVELDAGLGVVADAIISTTESRFIAVTRPGLATLLDNYFAQNRGHGIALSDFEDEERYKLGVSAVVSSRLIYSLFDCNILKRFLRFRDTILSAAGRLLPTDFMVCAALITAGDVSREKRDRASFWLQTPFGVKLSSLYSAALEEEFLIPEIGVPTEKITFVSDILGSRISLYHPEVTEESVEEFDCQYVFLPKEECAIDGIILWCQSVVSDQVVTHTRTPPTSSITCLLEQPLNVWPGRAINVTCYFKVNHARSYDIFVHYCVPHVYDSDAAYSLMLAKPHPFGKTLRREPDLERVNPEGTLQEDCEASQPKEPEGDSALRKRPESRGFLF